jgi:hypothetical protein
MGDWWEEALPARPPRRPDLPSETLEAGNRLVVQVPVALEYWMDNGQRAYVLEALQQRLNSEMGMRGFRVDSVRIETGVVLDPADPDAELLSLNQPVDEWPNLVSGNGLLHLRMVATADWIRH